MIIRFSNLVTPLLADLFFDLGWTPNSLPRTVTTPRRKPQASGGRLEPEAASEAHEEVCVECARRQACLDSPHLIPEAARRAVKWRQDRLVVGHEVRLWRLWVGFPYAQPPTEANIQPLEVWQRRR